ncbi:hypothetical protein CAEBREN_21569 [Caenorhabditis brenneri]|uniref:Uncharacterized protein n=1 Tax=Caenorhabditis brenneri TaxID=135651 RepID=G0MWY6_CAEBE|nr:hypothetical protein CAEBREN_21569 [Caenorhabditis brenneri]
MPSFYQNLKKEVLYCKQDFLFYLQSCVYEELEKDKNATAVVRIFDNGGLKFVMESELFAAINLKNPDKKPLECIDIEGHYRTIEYKHVLERYREKITEIDKYRYFINLKLFQKLREELAKFWKPIEDRPVKKVRNVGPQGFTVEDLIKELKYLGYTKIFPEINANARATYAIFLPLKPSELKTCDLFSAIHGALTFVLTKRYPCLTEFMYRQKVCLHNRTKPCEPCSYAIKEAEARIEAEIKAESEQASSTVNATTSGDDAEKEEDSKESKHESVTNEAPEKTINNPVEAETNPLPAISEPEVSEHDTALPDSNTHICEKCMETSNEGREEVTETYRKMRILGETVKEKDAELEKLNVYEEKSKKSDETEKNTKGLEKEAEEWKMKYLKILEENVKMGNILKSTGSSKTLERQVKEKDEQLKKVQKALEEKEQKCEELGKTIKEKNKEIHDLSEFLNRKKEEFKATINRLLQQLVDKDKQIGELENARTNAETSQLEAVEKLKEACFKLEKKVNVGLDQMKIKNSKIQELELKNAKLTEENQEIEELTKQHAMVTKENKKEIEQLKRNASISVEEIKKLTARIAEKEGAENLLKRSNKG